MEFKMKPAPCSKQEDGPMGFFALTSLLVVTVEKGKGVGLFLSMMFMKLRVGEECQGRRL